MAKKLDSIDSGSNYNFGDKLYTSPFPSSVFSLSHNNTISFPPNSNGMLIPILTLRTVPTDKFSISVQSLLRVLPQVVPMYARQRMYIHAFYCRGADLWNSWNVFASKGYNGKRNLTIPTINATNTSSETISSNSLFHYLYGLPIGTNISAYYNKLSALPAMMYLKIYRDYFMNKNFYQDNLVWLPDDDADFRLKNDGSIISDTQSTIKLNTWQYRDFADDYFTSSLPSPQRGTEAYASFNLVGDIPVLFKDFEKEPGSPMSILEYSKNWTAGSSSYMYEQFKDYGGSDTFGISHKTSSPFHENTVSEQKDLRPYALADNTSAFGTITLEALRRLAINQTELEKMAHTDGSYREFGLSFFGMSSKTAIDYRPVYIGGSYQPIVYSEVIQTVPYKSDNVESPLGTYGGHGISSDNSYIGDFTADDYGYIMVLASIMPDTYYSQGLQKQFTDLTQSDLLLPERAKLGMVPILNKELYFQNTSVDDDLFAYQDIFDDYRYLPNVVHGAMADKNQKEFFPYTQSRYFESLPTYSQSFATTKQNVRMDFLTAPNFIPYTCQFGFNIRAVRPLPYRAVPASLI